jgi:eukaryotic-like serine/threonine-protein kinase
MQSWQIVTAPTDVLHWSPLSSLIHTAELGARGLLGATRGMVRSAARVSSVSRETTLVVPRRRVPGVGDLVDGKYRIQRRIGKGAMGTVVAARHELLQRDVALKFVSAASVTPDVLARFRNEARMIAAIQSEHIARVLDAGHLADGTPFFALELLEGDDLEQVLRKEAPLPMDEVIDWILQALEGLAEAHALGIVHRDLKPANLFLARRRDGTRIVKLLDFGVSKQDRRDSLLGSVPTLTVTSSILGSPVYMAPEQLRDAKRVDPRADIWAIGVVLYELLVGRVPFAGENMPQLLLAVLESDPASPRTVRAEVPPALDAAVMRCLSRDTEARFQNVADLADALAPFGTDEARNSARRIRHIARSAIEWNGQPKGPRTTRRLLAVAIAVVAIGAAAAATLVGSGLLR